MSRKPMRIKLRLVIPAQPHVLVFIANSVQQIPQRLFGRLPLPQTAAHDEFIH
jgi:hypothetical protein